MHRLICLCDKTILCSAQTRTKDFAVFAKAHGLKVDPLLIRETAPLSSLLQSDLLRSAWNINPLPHALLIQPKNGNEQKKTGVFRDLKETGKS